MCAAAACGRLFRLSDGLQCRSNPAERPIPWLKPAAARGAGAVRAVRDGCAAPRDANLVEILPNGSGKAESSTRSISHLILAARLMETTYGGWRERRWPRSTISVSNTRWISWYVGRGESERWATCLDRGQILSRWTRMDVFRGEGRCCITQPQLASYSSFYCSIMAPTRTRAMRRIGRRWATQP